MIDELDDIHRALARIEKSQADLSHEFQRLRADIAILSSRQNSTIADTKKKRGKLPTLYTGWQNG